MRIFDNKVHVVESVLFALKLKVCGLGFMPVFHVELIPSL
jgi:hypothetical protein